MRRLPLVSVMVALVGAVLAVSLWTMRTAGQESLRESGIAQSDLAKSTANSLRGYLDWFDRDTRILAELAQGTRRQSIDARSQDEVILAAFQALATVVAHYRTIALFGPGHAPVVAVDPTEDRAHIAPALLEASARVAREVSARARTAFRGPLTLPGPRSFYLYAAPAGAAEAVVVTADAAMLFELASRAPSGPGNNDLVVVDPSGAVWLGCQQRQRCRLYDPDSPERAELLATLDGAGQRAELAPNPATLVHLGLPSRIVVGTAPPLQSPLGLWSVGLISSASDIDVRQRAFLWHLVLTSIGVASAMLTVGVFLLRQHAKAAALGARLQAAEEVATLRERSDKILENVPVGIVGITRDGKLAMTNRFFQERIARAQGGALDEELARWTSRLRGSLERVFRGRGGSGALDASVPEMAQDYHVRMVPLSNPTDEIESLALVEDLSELHALQRQLVRAEKLVTVGVLSAGIAHEVGTPLMVIRGRTEHLLETLPEGDVAHALRAIVGQIDAISVTIRQALDFSREQPLELGPTDARSDVEKAKELLEWRLSAKHIALSTSYQDSLPDIAAAPQQFEQVVVNLLMNACDASQSGGRIEVRLARDEVRHQHVRLEIADHGVGIPARDLNAVFDPYFTTKKDGEGTGLGLAIVSQIVRSHKGEVTLTSSVGEGTVVTVLWPIVPSKKAVYA